jgi:hypothetical protein
MLVMAGATAVGGGDFTVVVLSVTDRENELLLLVESVTMACAEAPVAKAQNAHAAAIFVVFDIVLLLGDDVFTAAF